MARVGSFSGPTFVLGAPLLSVHPIDNKFPEPRRDDDGEIQPVDDEKQPKREADDRRK